MSIKNKKSGFTLVELLVVMVILGILATIGFGYFYSSQAKARDAQRKSDLNQLQKALEMFYNDKGRYRTNKEKLPPAGQSWEDEKGTIYIKTVPGDPKGGKYCYESDDSGSYYKIYAKLENIKDSAIEKSGCAECSCMCEGEEGYCYKVESPNAP